MHQLARWALLVTALTQAHPPLTGRAAYQLLKGNDGMRQLLWLWGDDGEVTEEAPVTGAPADPTLLLTTFDVVASTRRPSRWRWWLSSADEKEDGEGGNKEPRTTPAAAAPHTTPSPSTSTKKPSRWRSWLSFVGTKISKGGKKVKEELVDAKEVVGRAIIAGGNATKEGILGAGRAIKKGAKRFGAAIKEGFKKVRLRFAGTGEKFRIVANRLKEKLEAGDEKALALMEKLGINVVFFGRRITGSSVENNSLPVSEVLKNEGLLSNKSVSHTTVTESPKGDLSLSTAGGRRPPDDKEMSVEDEIITEDVIHSNEESLYPDPDARDNEEAEESRDTILLTRNESSVAVKSTTMFGVTALPTTTTQLSTNSIQPSTIKSRSTSTTHLSFTTRLRNTTPPPTTTTIRSTYTTHLPTTSHPTTTKTQSEKTTAEPLKTTPHPSPTTRPYMTTTQPPAPAQPITTRTSTSPTLPPVITQTTVGTLGTDGTSDRTKEGPREPPPFPDVFGDIEVRDRLKTFYDNGDFSHAELREIFNFDPDNYEYYYDYYE